MQPPPRNARTREPRPNADFTGWTVDGGFAERLRVPAAFAYPLDESSEPVATAPLLCAGIVGFRALRATGLFDQARARAGEPPFRLGLLGFGAAGHLALQLARARGAEVYVMTRDRARHQALARELGARWVGDAAQAPPGEARRRDRLAPAGELVPPALALLAPAGRLDPRRHRDEPAARAARTRCSTASGASRASRTTRQDGADLLRRRARRRRADPSPGFPAGARRRRRARPARKRDGGAARRCSMP
jgi:propanol-preferring alcohol dehydrogenase